METIHIHIKGCVQGVGFRPFVYRLAKEHGLVGWVCNTSQGVHIEVSGPEDTWTQFYKKCIDDAPELSRIVSHSIKKMPETVFEDFRIIESNSDEEVDLAIMPDLAICNDCLKELNDPLDRRNGYAFITCTNCGPRYSIIEGLPYDRPYTSMHGFIMCSECQNEYDDPLNRRYYSQTNSCKECGITLKLLDNKSTHIGSQDDIVKECVKLLNEQKIVAVKGLGGYLLLCSAGNSKIVNELRNRKKRPHKPFAVLISQAELGKSNISKEAIAELKGPESPIVVVPYSELEQLAISIKEVAPGLDQVGVMFPYAPLLFLLSEKFKSPLIATSANQSGMPIIYRDDNADFDELFKYADAILTHDRPIVMPQDDSVVKISSATHSKIILRRSRGMAPNYFHKRESLEDQILALGAELKSTFSITRKSNIYISQYLGNTETYENQEHLRSTLLKFRKVVGSNPGTILTDMHPNYFPTQLGKEISEDKKYQEIQHHEAHLMAVLDENDLLEINSPILGVVWDGTGYGHDGQIWGGEFFEYFKGNITRKYHLDYFPVLSGDLMAIEPRISALSLLDNNYDIIRDQFSDIEWNYFFKAKENGQLVTSSMGRVFDAISCLLGLINKSTYEGQASMKLEMMAADWFTKNSWKEIDVLDYFLNKDRVSLRPTVENIIKGLKNGHSVDYLAAQFHETLIRIILDLAEKSKYYHMVFSGGVFQNGVLVDLLKLRSGDDYKLYFHKDLSPNDENISFGQLIHYLQSSSNRYQ